MSSNRTRRAATALLTLLAAASVAATVALRPDHAIRAATGLTSHLLCSEHFVAGRDLATVHREVLQVQGAYWLLNPLLRYTVDPQQREVLTTVAGLFASRAVYRDGAGCTLVHDTPAALIAAAVPEPSAAQKSCWRREPGAIVEPTQPELRRALDNAFADGPTEPLRLTKAVVVLHRGRVVAERYAPGYGIETLHHGWSATKSVVNALIGIQVQQGHMRLEDASLFPAWRGAGDPRRRITIEHLLRQTSGLELTQTNSGLDPSSIMKFERDDMAAMAEAAAPLAEPGTRWDYADGHYVLLSRLLRERAGGTIAAFRAMAERELFAPLGLCNITFEADAAGSPIGSAFMFATARDWARMGQLYLDDGVVGGQRLLPAGWVAWSVKPTLDTGYGAGFFTNRVSGGEIADWGTPWELPHAPKDAYYARGYMGQLVVVVPSHNLVVVRMGPSHVGDDETEGTGRLVADVIEALEGQPSVATPAR